MSSPAVTAALQDALEKGDIVELEQAIKAAEDDVHVSAHARKTPSSSLRSLIARAKNMYLVHMDACKTFVRPLRKACKELNEHGIFEALVKARRAPDEVQLCMYTDLCNAESLRREIMEAQRLGVRLQESTSAKEVDDFLTECSPLLDDRTILALVERREVLLREKKQHQAMRSFTTPLRGGAPGFARSAAERERNGHGVLEGLGRCELDDKGVSPVIEDRLRSAYRTSRSGDDNRTVGHSVRVGHSRSSEKVAHSSSSASTAYAELRNTVNKVGCCDLQGVITEGASPWMQAMRALHQQAYEEVVRAEHKVRQQLEDAEEDARVGAYREEICSRVQHWRAADAVFDAGHAGRRALPQGDDIAGVTQRRCFSDAKHVSATPAPGGSPPSPSRGSYAATEAETNTDDPTMRVYATQSLTAYTFRPKAPQLTPTRSSRGGTASAVEGAILGSAVRQRAAEEFNTPRMFRETPNISPIKEISTVSGVASLSDQDQPHHRSNGRLCWGDGLVRGSPSEGIAVSSSHTAADTLVGSSAVPPLSLSLELRRIQARLRAVQQEEEIHRHDIEGTEDFDRSVFLFPVSARISLLRRTAASQRRCF
ncbi:hypothetical protein JKF63_03215 [Porcisia hertigi]|uniref:Uncharacterized protein n=1 Tax=Porcisia hertigi TaxID=2761500 RepID=A0A836HK89_9TRYP|nr:hypothetical protein JKF63_03215 [Porcisia hertigi]